MFSYRLFGMFASGFCAATLATGCGGSSGSNSSAVTGAAAGSAVVVSTSQVATGSAIPGSATAQSVTAQGADATGTTSSAGLINRTPAGAGGTPASPAGNIGTLVIEGNPPNTVGVGSQYRFQPVVEQAAGPVTFSVTGKPGWASFNATTGLMNGVPGVKDEGTTGHIVISASVGTQVASLTPFTIKVHGSRQASATLSWNPPTENTDGTPIKELAGYRIRYGTSSDALTESVTIADASTTSYMLTGLAAGTYYFAVEAFNVDGRSSPDSEIVPTSL